MGQVWYLIVLFPDLCLLSYFVTFQCGILNQVCYLLVSIPDLFHLSYFDYQSCFVCAVWRP